VKSNCYILSWEALLTQGSVGSHFAFYLFLISYLYKGFEPLVLVAILENKTTLLSCTIHTLAFHFRFHDCKCENFDLEVMSMALKSSLNYYDYSCSCGLFTSNSIMVIHASKHQTFIHFAFLVDMVSIYGFAMQWFLVSLIKILVQWFHTTHKLYDQIFGAISEMLFCCKSYTYYC
jgi:hypothetical protein